jgi:hypothetical protein
MIYMTYKWFFAIIIITDLHKSLVIYKWFYDNHHWFTEIIDDLQVILQ